MIDTVVHTLATLNSWQVVFILLTLPTLITLIVFGWMLLASSKRDQASMKLSALGIQVNFNASRTNKLGDASTGP